MHPVDLLHRPNYLTVSSRNLVRQFDFQEKILTLLLCTTGFLVLVDMPYLNHCCRHRHHQNTCEKEKFNF